MVAKIPKDHRGLYLSVPFSHGKQTQITEKMIKANLDKYEKMKTKNERIVDAIGLMAYGYEDTVIAARTELTVEEVKKLRRRK